MPIILIIDIKLKTISWKQNVILKTTRFPYYRIKEYLEYSKKRVERNRNNSSINYWNILVKYSQSQYQAQNIIQIEAWLEYLLSLRLRE